MSDELIRRVQLLQSFYDRVSTLTREWVDGQIGAPRLASRMEELCREFDKALRKGPDEPVGR